MDIQTNKILQYPEALTSDKDFKAVIKNIMQDIKTVIKKEGKDELQYQLLDGKTLIVEVIDNVYGCLEIAVERLNEFGNTEECSTDDYDCDDKTLWAMIENAIL